MYENFERFQPDNVRYLVENGRKQSLHCFLCHFHAIIHNGVKVAQDTMLTWFVKDPSIKVGV